MLNQSHGATSQQYRQRLEDLVQKNARTDMDYPLQLINKIREQGPICFRDFMDICLYHPQIGYYNSDRPIVGNNGDYFTSCTLSPVFGAVIAKQLEEMWSLMGRAPFTIVEYGAGTGALCSSVLTYLKNNKDMYEPLRYCIIERSPAMRDQERKILGNKVEWVDSIKDIGPIQGCILSNELFDNFAVHRVVMQQELMEVFVSFEDGFTEELRPAERGLSDYLSELGISLPMGYHTEINLQALDWLKQVGDGLERGYVLTIDYGYLSSGFYSAYRNQGTLMCYYKHKVHDRIYENIGRQDLTCHVNFSALINWGTKNGLSECGFTDQCQFLMSLGFRQALIHMLSGDCNVLEASVKAASITQTLLIDMGSRFKVLAQQKGMDRIQLTGFPTRRLLQSCPQTHPVFKVE